MANGRLRRELERMTNLLRMQPSLATIQTQGQVWQSIEKEMTMRSPTTTAGPTCPLALSCPVS